MKMIENLIRKNNNRATNKYKIKIKIYFLFRPIYNIINYNNNKFQTVGEKFQT